MSENAATVRERQQPVRRVEDRVAWQRARTWAGEIYSFTRAARMARGFGSCSQIQRAATSVMPGIAEGSGRVHAQEFHRMPCTAKASRAEVRSLRYLALDVQNVTQDQSTHQMTRADEPARIIGGVRASVARRIPA